MYRIALLMLFRDRTKYLLLISVLTFSSLLITQQSSVFCGLMRWTTSTLRNSQASIWVVDPQVEQVNDVKPMRSIDLSRVRSVEGVRYAMPLYFSVLQARLLDGKFKSSQLVGVDRSTFIGAPPQILQGRLEDLRENNTVIVDELAIEKLSNGRSSPIKIGDSFEINDKEARIVAICRTDRSFFGYPYVYTTYDRAVEYSPKTRKMLSFILTEPVEGHSADEIARKIELETGLKAFTDEAFFWSTIRWIIVNTGIPISFGLSVFLGFLVGIAVTGQTFYTFVMENLKNIGALKAMGATNSLLRNMLIIQTLTVGFIGYGMGVGLTALFGNAVIKKGSPPFFFPYQLLIISFILILMISLFAIILGVRKINKLEPAMVFRG